MTALSESATKVLIQEYRLENKLIVLIKNCLITKKIKKCLTHVLHKERDWSFMALKKV